MKMVQSGVSLFRKVDSQKSHKLKCGSYCMSDMKISKNLKWKYMSLSTLLNDTKFSFYTFLIPSLHSSLFFHFCWWKERYPLDCEMGPIPNHGILTMMFELHLMLLQILNLWASSPLHTQYLAYLPIL